MGKLGRDKNFYKYVDDKEDSAKDIKARVEYGISHTINKTNPYLNYIAFGNYTEDSLPYYLRSENYNHIKKNLDRLTLIEGDLSAFKEKKFDFFNLSDIFEYMSEQDFKKNINKISKIANKNARIAYWNMQNKRYINDEHFVLENELSKSLFEHNQSWFYRDFCTYKKATK
jgi:S-adenosylmethionine-diacylglycerol 3-amino-3-carboxypropyl transferase